MPEKLSQDEFAVLVKRAGIPLTPPQLVEMYEAWTHVEPMVERVRGHHRDRAAEPAVIFRPSPLPEPLP